jgi:hypothetical protein
MKKITFLTTILVVSLSFAQVPSYVPTNGLVGWWPFNGNANDESGNGNNGTVNGANLTTDRNGVSNSAYSFDGVNDKINIIAQTIIPQQSDYTVSFWFNSPFSTYNGAFLSFNSWFCKLGHDSPGFFYKDEVGNSSNNWYEQAHFNVQPTINTWNNLILNKTNNNVVLILNTAIIGNMTTYGFSNFNPSSLIQLGYYCCQEFFNGYLDDFGLWNRSLTDCEIKDIYHSQLGFTTINAGTNQLICKGDSVLLSGSGGIFLSWNNSVIDSIPFVPQQTNSYILTGGDTFGCVGSDTVIVSVLEPSSSSQTQTALDTYTWPVNNQTYTQSGTYSDTLVNAAGCDSIVTLNLTLSYTGINELNASQLVVSPNPTKDNFSISGLELLGKITSLEIKDAACKVVKVLDPTTPNFSCVGLKAGVYFLAVTSNKTECVIKIIKE